MKPGLRGEDHREMALGSQENGLDFSNASLYFVANIAQDSIPLDNGSFRQPRLWTTLLASHPFMGIDPRGWGVS